MKKRLSALSVILMLGLVSWTGAQNGSNAPFDATKSRQELEIMKGILSTTMSFLANDLRGRQARSSERRSEFSFGTGWWSSNVSAYYLYGQGAVFIVPVSGLSVSQEHEFADQTAQMEELNAQMDETRASMEAKLAQAEAMAALAQSKANAASGVGGGVGAGVGGGVSGGVVGGVPGGVQGGVSPVPSAVPAPAPAAQPAVPKKPTVPASQDDIRRRLAEVQEKVRQRREQTEQERQKLMETVAQAKVHLIEALANYGDSLTTVKPNEYVNLILTARDAGNFRSFEFDEARNQREVLSVQKSVITDYKAGRLSLDAFKQKVLQYSE
jgi:hypothetical protein